MASWITMLTVVLLTTLASSAGTANRPRRRVTFPGLPGQQRIRALASLDLDDLTKPLAFQSIWSSATGSFLPLSANASSQTTVAGYVRTLVFEQRVDIARAIYEQDLGINATGMPPGIQEGWMFLVQKLKLAGITVEQALDSVLRTLVTPRIRVVTSNLVLCSIPPNVSFSASASLRYLKSLLGPSDWAIMHKTCNNRSRTECSQLVVAAETNGRTDQLGRVFNSTFHRFEIGNFESSRKGQCLPQQIDFIDTARPDCRNLQTCPDACDDAGTRVSCPQIGDGVFGAPTEFIHRTNYSGTRSCSDTITETLCAPVTADDEVAFRQSALRAAAANGGPLSGTVDVCVLDVDIASTGERCPVTDAVDVAVFTNAISNFFAQVPDPPPDAVQPIESCSVAANAALLSLVTFAVLFVV